LKVVIAATPIRPDSADKLSATDQLKQRHCVKVTVSCVYCRQNFHCQIQEQIFLEVLSRV